MAGLWFYYCCRRLKPTLPGSLFIKEHLNNLTKNQGYSEANFRSAYRRSYYNDNFKSSIFRPYLTTAPCPSPAKGWIAIKLSCQSIPFVEPQGHCIPLRLWCRQQTTSSPPLTNEVNCTAEEFGDENFTRFLRLSWDQTLTFDLNHRLQSRTDSLITNADCGPKASHGAWSSSFFQLVPSKLRHLCKC